MRVAITGATGFIGRHVIRALRDRGDEVIALSRSHGSIEGIKATKWDAAREVFPPVAAEVDAVVNLAGDPIAGGRWDPEHRRRIRDSRRITTRRVVQGIVKSPSITLVSGSAIGFYGNTTLAVDETAPAGEDFLASVCVEWEAEANVAANAGNRVVLLRTGIVLSPEGGALQKLLIPARLGFGGKLGNGRQWQSWIHIADEVGIILHALDHDNLKGPVNATSPNPVHQKELARTLGRVLHRPAILPAPAFAIRLITGGASEVVLGGQRVLPRAALESGYRFSFNTLQPALEDLLN